MAKKTTNDPFGLGFANGSNSIGPVSSEYVFTPAYLKSIGITKTSKNPEIRLEYNNLANKPLQYTPASGIPEDITQSNYKDALIQFMGANPKAGSALFSKLGIPTNILNLSQKAQNVYWSGAYEQAVKAGFNPAKIGPVPLSDLAKAGVPKSVLTEIGTAYSNMAKELAAANQGNYWAAKQLQLGYAGIAAGQSQATAAQQANAIDNISSYLDRWGLGKDAPIIVAAITKAGSHIINPNALLAMVRGEAPTGLGPAADRQLAANYAAAFPGLTEYNKKFGGAGQFLSEDQYQQHVGAYANTAGQYGLPANFLTKAELGKLIAGNVSPAEFQTRMQDLYAATQNADKNVKDMLAQHYGITPNHLLAYFADPNKATDMLQRQVAQAGIQDYASRVGLNGLTPAGAAQLAGMAKLQASSGNAPLSVGVGNIESSLLNASRDVNLTGHLPGAANNTVNTSQLIGSQIAGFSGTTQQAAQTAVQRAEQAKAAPFESGGGPEETARGVIGVGGART